MKPPNPRTFDAWGVAIHGRQRGAGSILRTTVRGSLRLFTTRAKARAAARLDRSLGCAATPVRVRVTIEAKAEGSA